MAKKKKTIVEDKITLPRNPLDAIEDLNNMIKASMTTGMMTGSALANIHRGFTDNSISDKDRIMHVMRGAAFLGGQLYSAYRAFEELTSKRKVKTVESPDYEKLREENKKLKEEIEKLKEEIKKIKEK